MHPPYPLCSVQAIASIQVCLVPYVLHEHTSRRVHRTEEVPQMGSDCRVGMWNPFFFLFIDASDPTERSKCEFSQGMQFYNFIFLARSWASDRLYLANRLAWLGKRAQEQDIPLTFILYPEGTLVSPNTRPISKKYADKMGIVSDLGKKKARGIDRVVCSLTHNCLPVGSLAGYGSHPHAEIHGVTSQLAGSCSQDIKS